MRIRPSAGRTATGGAIRIRPMAVGCSHRQGNEMHGGDGQGSDEQGNQNRGSDSHGRRRAEVG